MFDKSVRPPSPDALIIEPGDDVAVSLRTLPAGYSLRLPGLESPIELVETVELKHKVALRDLPLGHRVIMYGVVVGVCRETIRAGQALTTANVSHATSEIDLSRAGQRIGSLRPVMDSVMGRDLSTLTWQGYHRPDGRVGTRNYWLIVPTVFCQQTNMAKLHEALTEALGYRMPNPLVKLITQKATGMSAEVQLAVARPFQHVDGIKMLTHQGGCGGTRQDSAVLRRLLASYIAHPNVAGATILTLGCEHFEADALIETVEDLYPGHSRPLIAVRQQNGGTTDSYLKQAAEATLEGLAKANEARRASAPLADLTLGLKCGASDGFSGITANPALGVCADLLVAAGGRALLAEFPELCGAEQDLVDRCRHRADAEQFVTMMEAYQNSARAVGSGFEANPSPGNIRDGLITDAMKSAGAARKGGTSPVEALYDYAYPVRAKGLSLVCTPGNDVEATTGLAAAGANLTVFTTGLGTPTGNPINPVVKVSTNTALAERMPDLIDFDCGRLIDGQGYSLDEAGREMLELLVDVASGRAVAAERLGQDDFIPWKRGISL